MKTKRLMKYYQLIHYFHNETPNPNKKLLRIRTALEESGAEQLGPSQNPDVKLTTSPFSTHTDFKIDKTFPDVVLLITGAFSKRDVFLLVERGTPNGISYIHPDWPWLKDKVITQQQIDFQTFPQLVYEILERKYPGSYS